MGRDYESLIVILIYFQGASIFIKHIRRPRKAHYLGGKDESIDGQNYNGRHLEGTVNQKHS